MMFLYLCVHALPATYKSLNWLMQFNTLTMLYFICQLHGQCTFVRHTALNIGEYETILRDRINLPATGKCFSPAQSHLERKTIGLQFRKGSCSEKRKYIVNSSSLLAVYFMNRQIVQCVENSV